MAIKRRLGAVLALVATTTLLVACGGTGSIDTPGGPVTLTWWHNGTADPLLGFWQKVADDYTKAHPNVKIEISAVQNEELQKTKIPAAMLANNPPDVFQQWGGGALADQVAAGKVMDITDKVGASLDLIGGSAAGWQVDGRTYGLPFSLGIEGFWYNKAQFQQAGITDTPKTLADLNAAVGKLKAAGLVPIAVGAKDKWPAAHSLQLFDLVWIVTGGGPANASATMTTYMINFGFYRSQFGYGSAVAVILFVISFVVASLYQRFVLRRDTEGAVTRRMG